MWQVQRPRRLERSFLHIPVVRPNMTPVDAVRWLLNFVEQDLSALSEARIAALTEEVIAFMGSPRVELLGPLGRRTLTKWQTVMRDRFKGYFSTTTGVNFGWPFKISLSGCLHMLQEGGHVTTMSVPMGSDPEVFSWYALQAILQVGDRFRQCQNETCGKLFVAQGRQRFCSIPCGNKIRVAQFRAKQKADKELRDEILAQRRAAYKKRARKKVWASP